MPASVLRRLAPGRASRRLAGRALAAATVLALVLPSGVLPAPGPAGAQALPSATPVPGARTTPVAPPAPPGARPPGAAPAATPVPGRPPQNDPAGPPSAYALARSDQLFVAKTQVWPGAPGPRAFSSTYSFWPSLSNVSGTTPYVDTKTFASDPAHQPFLLTPVRGRFTDGLHEQVLLLNQENNCPGATPGPAPCDYVTYVSPLPAEAAPGATFLPPWQVGLRGPGTGSPVAIATGDLDGRISAQGFPNDEAAVVYRGTGGDLQVAVLDYNVTPNDVIATSPAVALPALGTPAAGAGSLGVGVGDFDSDGQNEIAVVWQGEGCSVAAPRCLSVPHLSVLRYSNDGQSRSLAVLRADVPLPAALMTGSPATQMSFQVAVGDFDGQGAEELAFSYVGVDAGLAVLGFGRLDETFAVARFGQNPGDWNQGAYCPSSGCYAYGPDGAPQLVAGLFWYDEASGHGLDRRQLAMAAVAGNNVDIGGFPGSWVGMQVYDVSFDAASCAGPPCPLTLTGLVAGDNGGPPGINQAILGPIDPNAPPTISLAAGSFQGLTLSPTDAGKVPWVIAAGVVLSDGGGTSGQSTTRNIYYLRLSGSQPGQFAFDYLFFSDWVPNGDSTSFRLLAYDPAGASLVLGAPLVFTFTDHNVPTSILQDPPKHLDWFYDPQQKHGSWLQVDRSESLNLTVSDSTTTTYSSQTTTGSDWTIGGSATVNVVASGDAGLDKVAETGAGLDVSAEVGYQYDKNSSSYNASGSSYTLSVSGATNDDDLLVGTERAWTVYRYPILGYSVKDTEGKPVLGPGGQPQSGFYEITLPGQTIPFGPGGGRNFGDWYQPLHQNGNALSYPPIDSATGLVPLDPSVLGPPVVLAGSDDGGTKPPVTLPQPLLNKSYVVDPTGSSVSLAIAGTTGSGNSTSTTNTLSESVDADGAVFGKLDLGVGSAAACTDVDLKFNNSNSWSTLSTSSTTTTSTNTFTLQQDSSAQPNWAYGAATAYYTDAAGVYRAAHAVNLLSSTESAPEWRKYYGGRPDPALNLPDRMVMTYSQVDKTNDIPNWNDADSRQLIRGFFALHPDAAHGGQSGSLTAGAPFSQPTDGDTVQLQVRVHNYSLDTPATGVPVRFLAVPRDAADENNAGPPIELGSTTLGTIPPLGWAPANLLWNTAGRAPSGAQLYRVFVIVAANDPSKGAADPWNGVIHAWADRYDDPATVDGTTSGDRLIDPLTGQEETLEAGQNKQGWGSLTIYPKQPPSAPRATAGGTAARQATPLRFGSGGISVARPRAAAAASGASAVTADRVHEVRLHLAATTSALGNSYCHDDNNAATLQVYEGDPAQGGRLVGAKRVLGLAGSGPAGRWVTLPWTPRTAGRRQLVARLYGASTDPRATPVQTVLEVDVAARAEPAATLGRLLEVLEVVWLPADLRAALLARLQAANAAALAGDQPGARAALAALKAQTAMARGSTVSGYSESRVSGLVDALLAQAAIAPYCLPTSAALAAGTPGPAPTAAAGAGVTPPAGAGAGTGTGTPGPTRTATATATPLPAGTPAAAGTPAPGALPACAPGAPAASATATATGTPGTATPGPSATGTPAAGGTATRTPPAAGTPTPAGSGSPTPAATATATHGPGTPSPTPQRTATPGAPPTVVPPPLAPPTVVPPPLAPTPGAAATPAGPPTARDGQHLGLQPPEVQAAFRATHGDAADARWVAEHEAELARAGP